MRRFLRCCAALLLSASVGSVTGCSSSSPTGPTRTPTPTPTASPTPTATATPTPQPTPVVLRTATFVSANGYTTRGTARISRTGSEHALEMQNDFATGNSNALLVYLCGQSNCSGGFLNLGDLKAFSGAQTYALPNDGSAYRYVVIWCSAVNLAFGYGELR